MFLNVWSKTQNTNTFHWRYRFILEKICTCHSLIKLKELCFRSTVNILQCAQWYDSAILLCCFVVRCLLSKDIRDMLLYSSGLHGWLLAIAFVWLQVAYGWNKMYPSTTKHCKEHIVSIFLGIYSVSAWIYYAILEAVRTPTNQQ